MNLPKLFLASALLLGLSSIAFATQIDNAGGNFSRPAGGLRLAGAQLTLVSGLPGYDFSGTHPGTTFAFQLSAPDIGNTTQHGEWTFATPPSVNTLTFSDSTTSLTFSGSFTCSATSECVYQRLGPNSFVFSGTFAGLLNGVPFTGATTQLRLIISGNSGTSQLAAVPEIGTLGMVGMGLLGIAGFAKRKFSALT
jgi:hypothetical protein